MIRVALLADLHIGAPIEGLDGAERTDAAYRSLARLSTALLAEEPDAVAVAGDLFDRGGDEDRALAAARSLLDPLAERGTPVVMIAGNHDAESALIGRLEPHPSRTLMPVDRAATVVLDGLGLAVHGRSIGRADETRDLSAGYPPPVAGGLVDLGLLHTSLDGVRSRRVCAPTTVDRLHDLGYDTWGLGHVHERLVLARDPLVLYPGSGHARRREETGGRGFSMLELEPGAPAAVTHVDTAVVRYERFEPGRDAADGETDTALRARMTALDEVDGLETVLWTIPRDGADARHCAALFDGARHRLLPG